MDTGQLLTQTWQWDWTVLAGCASLTIGYMAFQQFRPKRRWWWFGAGIVVLVLALVSPLHTLGDTYLFSAHMLQHMLLVLVVPPLLIKGLPPKLMRRALQIRWVGRTERILAYPLVAWLLGIGTICLWHLPVLYEGTLESHLVHVIEHLSFLVTSTIFWWPILNPVAERRLDHFRAIFYLIAATVVTSLLGVALSFAPPLYPGYARPIDLYGLLPFLRNEWGLSVAMDQQIGGMFMWVLGGPFYLCAVFGILARWFSETEAETSAKYKNETTRSDRLNGAVSAPTEEA